MNADHCFALQELAVSYADCIGRGDVATATISSTCASLEMVPRTVHVGLVQIDGDRARARTPSTEWAGRAGDLQLTSALELEFTSP